VMTSMQVLTAVDTLGCRFRRIIIYKSIRQGQQSVIFIIRITASSSSSSGGRVMSITP